MSRILLVDDSPAARHEIARRLIANGHDVTEAPDAIGAAEMALARPPDVVVSDLWMPNVSGVLLCRLLRAEPSTSHVPVVLITAASQRRSKFWARTAGAYAYVDKEHPTALIETLARLAREHTHPPVESVRPASRTSLQSRLFQRLDAALFESTVSGSLRSLASTEGDLEGVFRGLAALVSELANYRWIALHVPAGRRLFVHAHTTLAATAETEARAALRCPDETEARLTVDDRPVAGVPNAPVTGDIRGGDRLFGTFALGPCGRGASREDRELVSIVASELGGPLRVVLLAEQMRRLATSDPLTQLLNRRAFLEEMSRGLAVFERHGTPMGVLLLDVDHFKQVNDEHGHDGGDAVLTGIAERLRAIARKNDVVARWGGEELVIGLSHTGLPGCGLAGERIRRAIEEQPFRLPHGKTVAVTASIGVAAATRGEGLDRLIARADRAMYLAKSRGRNRCEVDDGTA